MGMRIPHRGIRYHITDVLSRESEDRPFRIAGAEPFFFKASSNKLTMLFRGQRGTHTIATLTAGHGDFYVETPTELSPAVLAHVQRVIPAIGDACLRLATARADRAATLADEAMMIVGPRERSRKVGVLTPSSHQFMTLSLYGNRLCRTLPAPLAIGDVEQKTSSSFTMNIMAKGEKGVQAHVMTLRSISGRIEATTEVGDQKSRAEFFDFIYATMRTQHAALIADPELQADLRDLAAQRNDLSDAILRDLSLDKVTKNYAFRSGDERAMASRDDLGRFVYANAPAPVIVPITGQISATVQDIGGRRILSGIKFRDDVISSDWGGAAPGIPNPGALWAITKARIITDHPDLMPDVSDRYAALRVAPRGADLDTELEQALDRPDTHAQLLEI